MIASVGSRRLGSGTLLARPSRFPCQFRAFIGRGLASAAVPKLGGRHLRRRRASAGWLSPPRIRTRRGVTSTSEGPVAPAAIPTYTARSSLLGVPACIGRRAVPDVRVEDEYEEGALHGSRHR